jgi:hypothetical protein
MKVLIRMTQHILDWDKLEPFDVKMNEIEKKFGFPPKRRYRMIVGADNTDTLIVEWEFPSMKAYEEALSKASMNPEYIAASNSGKNIVSSSRIEALILWPPQL